MYERPIILNNFACFLFLYLQKHMCMYVCIINKYVWEKAYVGFHGTYLSITATWRSQSNDLFHKQEYFILFCWMFKSKAHLKKKPLKEKICLKLRKSSRSQEGETQCSQFFRRAHFCKKPGERRALF